MLEIAVMPFCAVSGFIVEMLLGCMLARFGPCRLGTVLPLFSKY